MVAVRPILLAGAALVAAGCDRVLGLEVVPDAPPRFDAPGAYAATVLADEPLAYFRLGEQEGVTAANVVGGPTGQYVSTFLLGSPGAIRDDPDTAVMFGPGPAGVLVGDELDFPGRAPFTLEAWVKPVFDGTFNEIVSKWRQPPTWTGYLLYTQNAQLSFGRVAGVNEQDLVQWTGLVADRYTHVAATYDGATLHLYADGVEVGQKPGARMLPDTDVSFVIGAGNGTQFGSPFHGLIDEVAVYGSALDGARIYEHAVAGR